MNALALQTITRPMAPLGLSADLRMVEGVLKALEHGHTRDLALNAAIYRALGWQVATDWQGRTRRRIAYHCRSPLANSWERLPDPTGEEGDAKKLVPYGWDWTVGIIEGKPRGCCWERTPRPGRTPRFAECNRLSEPRALASAALFAVRQILMERG